MALSPWIVHNKQTTNILHLYWHDGEHWQRICDNLRDFDYLSGGSFEARHYRHCLRCQRLQQRYTAHDEVKDA